MADLSRRSLLTGVSILSVAAVPVAAASATASPDADIIAMAARIVDLAAQSLAAETDLADLDEQASDLYPAVPSMLRDGLRYSPESFSCSDDLRKEIARIEASNPSRVVLQYHRWRLVRLEAWEAECGAINDRLGIPDAAERNEALDSLLIGQLVPTLTGMQPVSMLGLAAKAEAVSAMVPWGEHHFHKALVASFVADEQWIAKALA